MLKLGNIQHKLEMIDDLPVLPVVATKLMTMIQSPDVSMGDVSKLMISDPSITAKILKMANSAYYSTLKKVDTVRMALVIMGQEEISNIIFSLSLFKAFGDKLSMKQQLKYYEHAVATGHIARILARELNIRTHGTEYTGGVLHDIGLIVLNQYFHDDFVRAVELIQSSNFSTKDAMIKIFGVSHMQIGAWIATQWKLPDILVECISFHQEPWLATENQILPAVVQIANILSNILGYCQICNYDKDSYTNSKSWDILLKLNPKFNIEDFYVFVETQKSRIEEYIALIQANV